MTMESRDADTGEVAFTSQTDTGEVSAQEATPQTVGGILSSVRVTVIFVALITLLGVGWMHLAHVRSQLQATEGELEAFKTRAIVERQEAYDEGQTIGRMESALGDISSRLATAERKIETNSLALSLTQPQPEQEEP